MNGGSRRRFLASTATLATTQCIIGANSGTAQSGQEYDVIRVGAGETFTKHLSEGETWGNKLIDITASGADYDIHTQGNSCTIRNIGVRGVWDSHDDSPFIAYTTDPNGEVLVENIYLADGSTATSYPNGNSGVFVPPSHAGTVIIRNLHYADNPSNGVYGSPPGNPSEHPNPGNRGDVIIEDSYSRNHASSGFRVGTDGSRVENCVAVDGNRGGWGYFADPEFIDCDFSGNVADIEAGNGAWSNRGTVTVTNCRYETTRENGGTISGSSVGAPQRTQPEEVSGVPLTPEEAASGKSSGTNETSGTDNGTSPDDDGDDTESRDEGKNDESSSDGEVHPGAPLDDNESVITFSGTHLTSGSPQTTDYILAVSDELTPSTHNNASVDDDDLPLQDGNSRVDGAVANWKDAYVFRGEITELTVDGPAKVFLNGDEIDPTKYGNTNGSDDVNGDNGTERPQNDGTRDNDNSETDDSPRETPSVGDARAFEDEGMEEFLKPIFDELGLNNLFKSLFD